ncbi:glutamine--fructose-6-phosphate transaminase (isomerizing) [Hyphomicrobiales bacterium]|nr:glutamine--fructose-6-phosphate transaminase (isomerizing) [Hyphomicrobiales bacterium]MDB9926679.1 glutamine--fructose-6-phosphate transaminase (isomerizing) [Hyphomicrobiales bacterium]
MCGIIGLVSNKEVSSTLLEGLKRLEYRGYDSSGIATINDNKIERVRSKGNLSFLEEKLLNTTLPGNIGIGHTRWATHGTPEEKNAHPHITDKVAIVHNGIIENNNQLRNQLIESGVEFSSDTDTEVVCHVLTSYLNSGLNAYDSVRATMNDIRGTYALGVLVLNDPDKLYAVRGGSPIAIGSAENQNFIGSDTYSLSAYSNNITYLKDGDIAVIESNSYDIYDHSDSPAIREKQNIIESVTLAEKGIFKHFMSKEIHEQPEVVSKSLANYIDMDSSTLNMPNLPYDLSSISNVTLVACGSSFYAGLISRDWFEKFTNVKVDVEIASEFRYREPPMDVNGLTVFISQSGETADTLAALRHCKSLGQKTISIVNVGDSSMCRNSDSSLKIYAGPEIGVASTKAFTCQLVVLACLAIKIGVSNGSLSTEQEKEYVQSLLSVPRLISNTLDKEDEIIDLAHGLSNISTTLYLGRGQMYPVAMEGALKLKEISYVHAEGYPAGEMKHGPIALLEKDLPVFMMAPTNKLYEKTISNLNEVIARDASVILLTDEEGLKNIGYLAGKVKTFILDKTDFITAPFVYTLPNQLIAYHIALLKGTDVDQPRNLAKSVTVE